MGVHVVRAKRMIAHVVRIKNVLARNAIVNVVKKTRSKKQINN